MKKWFKDLIIGDIIANSKLKVGKDNLCYFDEEDCDYLQIDKIKKGIIYTTNIQTNEPMELWCGEGWDNWAKEPSFKIVNEPSIKPLTINPIQLNLFDMI